jgi:hypothetical protein
MFDGILTAFELILVAVFFGLLIGFVLRMLGCLFSSGSRKKVRARPVLHVVWLIASSFPATWLYYIVTGCPGEKRECKREVVSVAMALHYIHERYGRFPLQSSSEDHAYDGDQALLLQILCGAAQPPPENPDQIRFIELSEEDQGERGMIDPWGNPVHIVADWSGDGRVSVGTKILDEKIAVWSDGPDGKNESGSGDDITSW